VKGRKFWKNSPVESIRRENGRRMIEEQEGQGKPEEIAVKKATSS